MAQSPITIRHRLGTPLFAGGVAGGPGGVGFPIRRHSSAAFAANRRYSSNALLSPSTAAQVSQSVNVGVVWRCVLIFSSIDQRDIGTDISHYVENLCCVT